MCVHLYHSNSVQYFVPQHMQCVCICTIAIVCSTFICNVCAFVPQHMQCVHLYHSSIAICNVFTTAICNKCAVFCSTYSITAVMSYGGCLDIKTAAHSVIMFHLLTHPSPPFIGGGEVSPPRKTSPALCRHQSRKLPAHLCDSSLLYSNTQTHTRAHTFAEVCHKVWYCLFVVQTQHQTISQGRSHSHGIPPPLHLPPSSLPTHLSPGTKISRGPHYNEVAHERDGL